jgi:hypothetical protein
VDYRNVAAQFNVDWHGTDMYTAGARWNQWEAGEGTGGGKVVAMTTEEHRQRMQVCACTPRVCVTAGCARVCAAALAAHGVQECVHGVCARPRACAAMVCLQAPLPHRTAVKACVGSLPDAAVRGRTLRF